MKEKFLLGAIILSVLFLTVTLVSASHQSVEYSYLIGVEPIHGPAIARAFNGETIEITGSGTIRSFSHFASGGGTLVHKDKDGNIVGRANWTAVSLLSFTSYGSASLQGLPEEFEGGKAYIKVRITPEGSDVSFDGVLMFECVLGDFPSNAIEGARLNVKLGRGSFLNFYERISGDTLFIRE